MSPHHFQQLDRYHEHHVGARIAALSPHDWGVVALEVDAAALGAGQIRLTRFVGVLPDGTPLAFEGGEPEAAPARPVEQHFPAGKPVLEVFLGAPKERESGSNLADGPAAVRRARYTAVTRSVGDTNTGGSETAVAFAQRNLVLLFDDEPRDDYEAIRIAEIVRDGTGALAVSDSYVPPCLRIEASQVIMTGLRRLLVLMQSKQRELAEQRQQRDSSSVEFSATDVTRYLQLAALNGGIPLLTHMATVGDVSPQQAYFALIQLAGQLASFAVADRADLPGFAYTDLRASFEALFSRITALLRTTVREAHVPVPLEVRQGMHIGKLEDDRLLKCPQFVLAVKAELPEEQTAQHVPARAKIAAWSQIEAILRAATPGVRVQVTHRPPPEVPIRAGVVYFTVDVEDTHWKAIQQERTVAIYLLPPFESGKVKIELLGIPPKER